MSFFCAPLWAFSSFPMLHGSSVTYTSGRLQKDLTKPWVGQDFQGEKETVNRLKERRHKGF